MGPKLCLLLFLILSLGVKAQYSEKDKDAFHKQYHDSLKAMNYPYVFPIWGKKAYKKGFDVPFPWGIGPNYFAMRQEIKITRTAVGFNNNPPVDLTNVIQFGKITTQGGFLTVRPDVWVLPFLDIYGIFGGGHTTTTVPLVEPVAFETVQESAAQSMGFGFTLAGGFHGIIVILDNNFNFATNERLLDPVPAYTFDGRLAHNFPSANRADRNITVWVGGFFQTIKADTRGEVAVKDVFPGVSQEQKDKIEQRLNEWLDGLGPVQKPIGEQIVKKISDYFHGVDAGNGTIQYQLDKRLAGPWNMIFGSQYQHNKNWMIRIELGTFGKRSSFLLSLNYRFLWLKR